MVVLGIVSLLNDVSSEMIYPLLPVFLTGVMGASALALGAVEGVAEATAALLKLGSGVLSDRGGRRKPWVVAGYGLAGGARPLIALAATWPLVLGLRFADRIGKGLRTSPRDALIADVTPPDRRARAFGFNRAMDHAGGVLGPLVAAALLTWAGMETRTVFLLAAVPALATVLLVIFGVHERGSRAASNGSLSSALTSTVEAPSPEPVPSRQPEAPDLPTLRRLFAGPYRRLLLAIGVFTLGNSTDAFLLLSLSNAGLTAAGVALLWSLFHLVRVVSSWWGGRLADRRGRRFSIAWGWSVYAGVYLGFAVIGSAAGLTALFLTYGLYSGLTEPAERAWVVDLAPAALRGSALGGYHAVVGLAALPASLLFGLLWTRVSPAAAFTTGAALALVACFLLLRVPQEPGVAAP